MIRELSISEALTLFARTQEERLQIGFPFEFERAHFVYQIEGRVLGRVSANTSLKNKTIGYVGFFDCDLNHPGVAEVSASLFQGALSWLNARGIQEVYGPVNYSTLFDYRFQIHSSLLAPNERFSWEPKHPPEFVDLILGAGFSVHFEYHSRAYGNLAPLLQISAKRYDEAKKLGFSTRPINIEGNAERELKLLSLINESAFSDRDLVEPFNPAAYRELCAPKYLKLLSDFSFFILNPEQKEIGYFFLFSENGYLVWKTLAILDEYQKLGIAGFGIHHVLTLLKERRIDQVVSALIRRGAPSEDLLSRASAHLLWEHRYAVFRKRI